MEMELGSARQVLECTATQSCVVDDASSLELDCSTTAVVIARGDRCRSSWMVDSCRRYRSSPTAVGVFNCCADGERAFGIKVCCADERCAECDHVDKTMGLRPICKCACNRKICFSKKPGQPPPPQEFGTRIEFFLAACGPFPYG